jgi:hypothetical protein
MSNLRLGWKEADMKQRLPTMAIALVLSGLLCACTDGRVTRPSPSSATMPLRPAAQTTPTSAITDVRGFYRSYAAARTLGHIEADRALVRTDLAGWYRPILEPPYTAGADPVGCGLRGVVTRWSFKQVGVLGGQAVIVIGSRPVSAEQELWIVVTAMPATGRITGITCSIGGSQVTRSGTRSAAASLYSYYITGRRQGASASAVIARLLMGGPTSGSSYLQQVKYAIARHELNYDPVTCMTRGVPDVAVGKPRIVAGGSVGLILASAHRHRAVVTIVLSAKGWTIGDIACDRGSLATAAR